MRLSYNNNVKYFDVHLIFLKILFGLNSLIWQPETQFRIFRTIFVKKERIFFSILYNMLSENAQKNLVALVIENTTIKNSKGKAYLYHFLVKHRLTISNENYVILNK